MPGLRNPENFRLKYATIGILTFVILTISITVYTILPSNIGMYNEKSKHLMFPWERNYVLIKDYEAKHPSAIVEYTSPKGSTVDKKLNDLLKSGLYNRDERKRLMTKVDKSSSSVDMDIYDKKMKIFISTEGMALDVYSLSGGTPKDKLLYEIKERGIYYWNVNINLIDEIDRLNLPAQIHDKNRKLKKYCALRIKSYELMYKVVEKDNDIEKNMIGYYDGQIETLIKELKSTDQSD